MNISTFEYNDATFELTYNNGFLAWGFDYNGKQYGSKVRVSGKKVLDIASIAFELALNAIKSYENLRLREGATGAGSASDDSSKS